MTQHQINHRNSTSLSPLPLLTMHDSTSSFPSTTTTSPSSRPSQRSYLHTGIGGAGNYHKYTPQPQPSVIPPSAFASSSTISSNLPAALRQSQNHHRLNQRLLFRSGIGGAGNVYAADDAASLSDEEYTRMKARVEMGRPKGRWCVGIGGAGNRRESIALGKLVEADPVRGMEGIPLDDGSCASGNQKVPVGLAEVLRRRLGSVLGRRGRREA